MYFTIEMPLIDHMPLLFHLIIKAEDDVYMDWNIQTQDSIVNSWATPSNGDILDFFCIILYLFT